MENLKIETQMTNEPVFITEAKDFRLPEPLPMDCGRVLKEVNIRYETAGTLNADRSNAVLVTHALSGKMQQLKDNPNAAICGDWFTAHGIGVNLGWIRDPGNEDLANKLRTVFAEWYDNGHTNEEDENTIILRIRLTDGILFHHGTRYEIDFSE